MRKICSDNRGHFRNDVGISVSVLKIKNFFPKGAQSDSKLDKGVFRPTRSANRPAQALIKPSLPAFVRPGGQAQAPAITAGATSEKARLQVRAWHPRPRMPK
jgi:hypothetical protein